MRLLVLGGTHHVGRAFVEAALARGDEVTTVTRGVSGTPVEGAEARHADRLDPGGAAHARWATTSGTPSSTRGRPRRSRCRRRRGC